MQYNLLDSENSFYAKIAPYKMELAYNECQILIGRGSAGAIPALRLHNSDDIKQLVVEIGEFLEINDTARLIVGGKHYVGDSIVNTLSQSAALLQEINAVDKFNFTKLAPPDLLKIGSNVVVTTNCIVQSGAFIGDNCILAPGTICSSVVQDNSIVFGNYGIKTLPADKQVRWWDGTYSEIIQFTKDGLPPTKSIDHQKIPVVVCAITKIEKATVKSLEIIGIKNDGVFVAMTDLPEHKKNYLLTLNDRPLVVDDEILY